jgi:hypothetical protein
MLFNKLSGCTLIAALCVAPLVSAQDRDRDRDRYGDQGRDRVTRLDPGTMIAVRTTQGIDSQRSDNRVYTGIVSQNVTGENGRVAIPRGSTAELIVRVARDNDLVLDLESVTVDGQRYAIQSAPNRVEAQRDNSVVGTIVGAINGGRPSGRDIHIPRESVVNFRLQQPLVMGVADRGVTRDGYHYHDYKRDDRKQ